MAVTTSETCTSNIDFARFSNRSRLPFLIQDINLGIVDWGADRGKPVRVFFGSNSPGSSYHRALGGTVVIHQLEWHFFRRVVVQNVCSGEHYAKARLRRPLQGHDVLRQRRRKEANGDVLRNQPVADCFWIISGNSIRQMYAGSRS